MDLLDPDPSHLNGNTNPDPELKTLVKKGIITNKNKHEKMNHLVPDLTKLR